MKLEKSNENPEIIDSVLKAAKELGYRVTDVNGKEQIGNTIVSLRYIMLIL